MTTTTPSRSGPTLDDLRNGPPTISVTESAPYLGVSRAYAYQMAKEGRLPTIKLGNRRVRVKTAALLRMLTDDAA
jgi:excisionase family DNA binding protein